MSSSVGVFPLASPIIVVVWDHHNLKTVQGWRIRLQDGHGYANKLYRTTEAQHWRKILLARIFT